jgi:hypothetical protein
MADAQIQSMDRFVNDAATYINTQGTKAGAKAFCELWPGIKKCLEDLKGYLPFWAQWLVDILEKIGDRACPAVKR